LFVCWLFLFACFFFNYFGLIQEKETRILTGAWVRKRRGSLLKPIRPGTQRKANMADESLLLLFWTVLAVLGGLFALWKYLKPRNANLLRHSTSQASENVAKARLKYFASRQEVVSDSAELKNDSLTVTSIPSGT